MAELDQQYVRQYAANVYHLAQQRGSRLRQYVTETQMKGESKTFPIIHPTKAVRVTSKYDDSPIIHTPTSVRMLRTSEFVWGDMVDWQDDLKMLIDPTSDITGGGAFALGRVIDDIIIDYGFSGAALEGKNGETSVPFPESQQIPVTTGSTSNTGMNLAKLKETRSLFGLADIDLDDPSNVLYFGITQAQLDDLLEEDKLTSNEYANVKALVRGDVDTFMGFKFVKMQRFHKTDGIRTCVAWAKSGIKLAVPQEIESHIAQRADKNFNWYSHMKLSTGACRMEDTKVVQIFAAE